MGRKTQHITQAEYQRRRQQSLRDCETQRRREQSERDRLSHRLTRALLQHVRTPLLAGPSARASLLPSRPPMAPNSTSKDESSSERSFESLFNNNNYSDVTVYLGESKIPFPAHRLVLGIRSAYFDTALRSEFKEGITNEIAFEKESPHAIWRVLQYIYKGDYIDEGASLIDSEGDDIELLKHPRVYALADMFQMGGLKQLACSKFQQQLQQHWISDTFPDCIREVYATCVDTTSPTLKTVVVDTVCLHHQELVAKPAFQELIREIGDFAVDLVLKMAGLS